ncbi:hypothetical protein DPMN_119552 [Dreissena polymorpha]|uniref:Uncharacterized protein n=1 Tax=Dreissena polymorpha TaxID=45954 RepID=A0A9D4GQ48_DREPO|nr:hypothetical protein DPMN_119552 [Dreissena polymorpha]
MPGRFRLSPGHYRRQPGLDGINRSQSGLTGTLPGCLPASTGAAPGNSVTALKNVYATNHPGPRRSTDVSKLGWIGALPAKVIHGLKWIFFCMHITKEV